MRGSCKPPRIIEAVNNYVVNVIMENDLEGCVGLAEPVGGSNKH